VNEYYDGVNVSAQLQKLVHDPTLGYRPLVGTAMKLKNPKKQSTDDEDIDEETMEKPEGQVFCFLPLPKEQQSPTGLPVHVNGYFSVSQNRRHLKWPTAGQHYKSDKDLTWNHCLLEELLPESYIQLILTAVDFAKKHQTLVDVYQAMPNMMHVDEKWQMVLEPLFMKLLDEEIFFTEADGGKWVELNECIVDCLKEEVATKKIIRNVLTSSGVAVVQIPMHLLMAIGAYHDDGLDEISPTVTRNTLKNNPRVCDDLPDNEKLTLLKYILKDEAYTELHGIPLLPLADGTYTTFKSPGRDQVYMSTENCPKELVPSFEHVILCTKLENSISQKLHQMAVKGM
jgi:sacsin